MLENNNAQIVLQNIKDNFSENDEKQEERIDNDQVKRKDSGGDNPTGIYVVRDGSLVKGNPNQSMDKKSAIPACRICLDESNDPTNPLLDPCKCAGTMKFIHLVCLQEWLHNRQVLKQNNFVKTYFWKSLECELC